MSIVVEGEERIEASCAEVWLALNDPEILRNCIPGCESLTKDADTEMSATVVLKVGPIKAKFSGSVELKDLKPPCSYTISGHGKGGVAGFAKGEANIELREEASNATVLTYTVKADVGGKIAQLGSRLITSTFKRLTSQFFVSFRDSLSVTKPSPTVEVP